MSDNKRTKPRNKYVVEALLKSGAGRHVNAKEYHRQIDKRETQQFIEEEIEIAEELEQLKEHP